MKSRVNASANFTLIQNLPDDVIQYLLPSRYCESDKMLKLATSIIKKIYIPVLGATRRGPRPKSPFPRSNA